MTARVALLLAVASAAALPAAAPAAEYVVTSTADGPGSCAPGSPTCTLRQAIVDAKGVPGRDTVRLPPGTYVNTGEDFIAAIGEQIDVVGTDPRTTTVEEVSGGDGRVFLVEQDASLRLTGVTVTGSRGVAGVLLFGGGNELRTSHAVLRGNTATAGAAIDATDGATVHLDATTIHGNTATVRGGGVRLVGAGTSLLAERSTISGNSAPLGAGIAAQSGTVALSRSTVYANAAGSDLDVAPGATARVHASALGGCTGVTPVSLGASLDAGTGCALAGPGDRSGLDPRLSGLSLAGGVTPVLHPLPGSPLLDADPSCVAGADQRGVPRPQGAACDIGAVEVAVTPPPSAPSPAPAPQADEEAAPPELVSVRLRPTRFRAGTDEGRGTRVRVRLEDAATLRVRVEKAKSGRAIDGRCRPPSRRTRGARSCVRWVAVRGAIERDVREGESSFRFSGRVGDRTLSPGRYRLVVRARARDGERHGLAERRMFRVLRRSR